LDDSEQQKEMLTTTTTRRHYNNEGGGLLTLSDSETEMTNYLNKNKKEFNIDGGHHHLINKLKKQKTPQRIPALEMVEVILNKF